LEKLQGIPGVLATQTVLVFEEVPDVRAGREIDP
jgi:hypothetical protein